MLYMFWETLPLGKAWVINVLQKIIINDYYKRLDNARIILLSKLKFICIHLMTIKFLICTS